jgi:hypothetical protein
VFAGEAGPTAAASGGGPEGDTGMEDTVDFDVPASHRVKVGGPVLRSVPGLKHD